ncbi:cilia- and flagella-associated protein 161 [Biomphalaria glabrata]|uniref:Cilia- and flagella-associated protein 161-like n=1 Tax=Biomphalaria glabrata TaxID=6526 RepID=A0A2C9M6Y6_BIOGL|nr:cilia- and flagella-associated protein 161-like [Biomphalaria glabrata]KAI8769598.1 cilia- and flagella-associated protein 161 [Biomphalaria glabrata]KAI8789939.1 cilia- and flagella-associated protein 161 [Biomphalaria glabrata]
MAHVRTYSPSVRVGNWNEEIQLEEDTLKDFLHRRANGQLQIQKSSGIIGKMTNPVQLSTSPDGHIRFGDTVLIVNKGNPDRTVYGVGQYPRDDSALAVHIPDLNNESDGGSSAASLLVLGTKKLSPCIRTAFKVLPANEYAQIGEKLRYSQPFYLVTAAPEIGQLALYSDVTLFSRCTDKARHQVAHLVPQFSFQCSWQIEHKNPLLRLEYEHEPVKANDACVIQHCKTRQNLCVEENYMINTFFGREYEISAHTYLDSHKAEKPVNLWMLVMGVAGDSAYPLSVNETGSQEAKEMKPSV